VGYNAKHEITNVPSYHKVCIKVSRDCCHLITLNPGAATNKSDPRKEFSTIVIMFIPAKRKTDNFRMAEDRQLTNNMKSRETTSESALKNDL